MSCVLRFLAFLLSFVFCFLLRFNELCKRIEDPSLVLLTHYYLSFVLANKMRRNYGGEDRQTHNQPYGDLVPFGDPNWYRGYASPFYKKTHSDFRLKCRSFVEKEILPFVHEWDESKTIPKEIYIKKHTKPESYQASWVNRGEKN